MFEAPPPTHTHTLPLRWQIGALRDGDAVENVPRISFMNSVDASLKRLEELPLIRFYC